MQLMDEKIAVVGATGLVGKELTRLLLESGIDPSQIFLFAQSPRREEIADVFFDIHTLSENAFDDIDTAFFCAGNEPSKKWIPYARHQGALVIDLSSAFRMHSHVPLVIPEINAEQMQDAMLIASPNCVVSIMLTALYPLHQRSPIRRICGSTYQAASGGGSSLLNTLYQHEISKTLPLMHNLYPHESPLLESRYAEEEIKIIQESRKIMGEDIEVALTSVRVPVPRAHSMALFIEFHQPTAASDAAAILSNAPGLCYSEDPLHLHPHFVQMKETVFCGRLKADLFRRDQLHLWVVGDQLLKGAALNAFQIYQVKKGAE
jgi:aspartate-semialdehyde dehydrogenase